MKQAHDDLEQARRIPGFGLDLYAGDDNLIFPFLELGGDRGHLRSHPRLGAADEGDGAPVQGRRRRRRPRGSTRRWRPRYDLLKVQTNPIAIKAALNLLGHEVGGFRLPMVEPTEHELEQVRGCLERAGILSAASA